MVLVDSIIDYDNIIRSLQMAVMSQESAVIVYIGENRETGAPAPSP